TESKQPHYQTSKPPEPVSVARRAERGEMLRRKPTKIEVKVEDKEELEEARKRAAAAASSSAAPPQPPPFSTTSTALPTIPPPSPTASIDNGGRSKATIAKQILHQKLLSLLSPFHIATHHQHNTFFDGSASELSSQRAVLRLRFHEETHLPKCFVCLKAKAVLSLMASAVSRKTRRRWTLQSGRRVLRTPRN
ncbi:UNVERIFIED_CONTAM: Triphosphate tunnel metalloenzyme 3, partial [Sesamum angustifolium]